MVTSPLNDPDSRPAETFVTGTSPMLTPSSLRWRSRRTASVCGAGPGVGCGLPATTVSLQKNNAPPDTCTESPACTEDGATTGPCGGPVHEARASGAWATTTTVITDTASNAARIRRTEPTS